ncbi:MAG: ABC transporter substrate-binding protein [Xanthobacteraceae bacterium]
MTALRGSSLPIRRREVLAAFLALPLARPAWATNEKKIKIGYLSWFPPSMNADLDRFREGMQRAGYVEGRDYDLEPAFTSGNRVQCQDIARKLVQEPVDILIAVATPTIQICKEASHSIPIVMFTANALATGLVPSLSRPGGNITGVSLLLTDLAGKKLELLRDIRPSLRAISFLGSTTDPNAATFVRETQAAADHLDTRLSVRLVDGPRAISQPIFDAMKADGSEAVIVQPIFSGYQEKIVPLANKAQLAIISDWSFFADAGALLTYGAPYAALTRRLVYYVDRILKGATPADLPIEQPTEFELVVNTRAAAELGWTIPQSILVRADRVIE